MNVHGKRGKELPQLKNKTCFYWTSSKNKTSVLKATLVLLISLSTLHKTQLIKAYNFSIVLTFPGEMHKSSFGIICELNDKTVKGRSKLSENEW